MRIEQKNDIKGSLIKQIKILSEASCNQMYDDGLSNYSHEMVNIYKELERPFWAVFLSLVLIDFAISLFIFVKKL